MIGLLIDLLEARGFRLTRSGMVVRGGDTMSPERAFVACVMGATMEAWRKRCGFDRAEEP